MQFRRQIAVVYTVPEVLNKVTYMRELGFLEHEIHIFAKNIQELYSFKKNTNIKVHQAGNIFDWMKALLSGRKLYEACLLRFKFSDDELQHYGDLIRKGAFLIIAEHEFPVEKQPTSYKLMKLPKQSKQVANPLNMKYKS